MTGRSVLVIAAIALSGCMSFARLDSARTAAPGTNQMMVAPSGYLGERKDANWFNFDVAYRRGLSARTDFGLRVNFIGASTDLKVQLKRAADPGRGVDIAVAPGIGWGLDITWSRSGSNDLPGGFQAALPLIVGINFGNNQLVLSPQVLYQRVPLLPDGALNLGATIAFGRTEGKGLRLYPAVAIWKALDPRDLDGSLLRYGSVMFQPSLVLRWGS